MRPKIKKTIRGPRLNSARTARVTHSAPHDRMRSDADSNHDSDSETFPTILPPIFPRSTLSLPIDLSFPSSMAQDLDLFQTFAHQSKKRPTSIHTEKIQYRTVLISSAFDFEYSKEGKEGLQSPVSVDFFNSTDIDPDGCCQQTNRPCAEGAIKRCEASVQRLARMNTVIEALSSDLWALSDDRHLLGNNLKQNRFFSALQSKLLSLRLQNHSHGSGNAESERKASSQLVSDLHDNARKCGPDMSDEVASLQMLQERTAQSIQRMLKAMSGDVPLCDEEAQSVLHAAQTAFVPAQRALSQAITRLAADRASSTLASRQAKTV